MFALPNAGFRQVAYVTSDLDAAMALFERDYGVPGFYSFSNADNGVALPGDPQLRIALARVGGVEIELIEPIGDTAPLYSAALPDGDALAIRFHHVAIGIDGTIEDWQRHRDAIDPSLHPIVVEGGLGDVMRYIYTDERKALGHYVEHVWMSAELVAQLDSIIPRFPAGR
ncbi:MAG: VOC family protein [Janthinobacterium lividum]